LWSNGIGVKGQCAVKFIVVSPMTSLVHVVALVLLATAAAYDNGLAALPPMGWNTWCTDDLCGMTLQQRLQYEELTPSLQQARSTAATTTKSGALPTPSWSKGLIR
jgi:hypothetical protein